MNSLLEKLQRREVLTEQEWLTLLSDETQDEELFAAARAVQQRVFGNQVYMRGLIEVSSYCKNDCYYCGIRRGNGQAERYRLTKEQILSCCQEGYGLGFRTFVLQGGEDPYFTEERVVEIVRAIKQNHPDCAVTLSLGEWADESYEAFRKAGADRYLLRHETANADHYGKLHPAKMSHDNRMRCLHTLKRLGYQTGCGVMVGSPFQTLSHLAQDLQFIQKLQPEMVGIGPFLAHHATPFADRPSGSVTLTLRLLALVRLLLPTVLLPATTALGTADGNGREKGILAGANVVMPNLSPADVRTKYLLYDNKLATGSEAAESVALLKKQMQAIGYELVSARGDAPQK